ncbi:N-terminal phage integrase SAM-like domain-containing protein [Corallococcus exercitus]
MLKLKEAWWVGRQVPAPQRQGGADPQGLAQQHPPGAEEYERQIRHALLTGTFGKENSVGRVPALGEFVPRFLTDSENNNNKHSSVVTKRQILDDHLSPVFGNTPLDAIGPAEIEDFKAAMRKKPSGARARKEAPTRAASSSARAPVR